MCDVAHTLVVADGQCQEGDEHHAAVDDVAVKEVDRVGNAHVLARLVDVIDQGIHALGEIISRADLDVGAGGRLRSKMRRSLQIAETRLGFHLVGAQNVAAAGDQVGFLQAQIGIATGLIHEMTPLNAERECGATVTSQKHQVNLFLFFVSSFIAYTTESIRGPPCSIRNSLNARAAGDRVLPARCVTNHCPVSGMPLMSSCAR